MADKDPTTYLARVDVIELAREQVDVAHFLWGAAGNTPGNSDGAWCFPARIRLHENLPDLEKSEAPPQSKVSATPFLLAAWSPVQGKWACGGRDRKAAGAWPVSNTRLQSKKDLKVGDFSTEDLEELKTHLADAENFRWPRPLGPVTSKTVVWGESCVGKRHFDCVGLVNWSISVALDKKVWYNIEHYKKFGKTASCSGVSMARMQAGDLLTRTYHIGIVTGEGTVVSALSIGEGVVEQRIDTGAWEHWTRPNRSLWRRCA
jgi:hypothetical protein